jgi:cytochrome P450
MPGNKIDINSAAFKGNPFPTLARLREQGPVIRAKLPLVGECWLTTTYEATNAVLLDKPTFVNDPRHAGRKSYAGMQWWMPKSLRALTSNMLGKDEPDHRRLRSLVEAAFVKRSIDELRPRIEDLVDRQLVLLEAAALSSGPVDFIEHFARPLPLAVICELLGLRAEDREKFTRWCCFTSVSSVFDFLRALGGIGKLQRYLKRQFELCREKPRPGMISALVAAEQQGERLSEEELLAAAFVLLVAGHETTVHLLACGLIALSQHPDQKAELTADWSKVATAVDEILRYTTPVQMTKPRYASRDVELFGQAIHRGEFCLPLLAAANCDPAEFPDPERFDITRHPNRHLSFGTGIHTCLGLKLAKAEAEIALEALYSRFADLELPVAADQLAWTRRLGLRSLRSLPVRLRNGGSARHFSAA